MGNYPKMIYGVADEYQDVCKEPGIVCSEKGGIIRLQGDYDLVPKGDLNKYLSTYDLKNPERDITKALSIAFDYRTRWYRPDVKIHFKRVNYKLNGEWTSGYDYRLLVQPFYRTPIGIGAMVGGVLLLIAIIVTLIIVLRSK